ncbi:MAG: restriction endonuclease subunit S [Bacteroidales bacterium]|nr:restriction endonuclease subunit S [Bacteroidales bacterium]
MAQRYDTYKDSGVQWLGEIPGHWECVQNRFIFKENVRAPQPNDIPLSLSQVDGLIPTDDMKESSLKTSSYDNWKRVLEEDIVLNRFKAHLGVLFASKYVGMVSFHYGVFEKNRPIVPKYYEYMFHSNQFRLILGFASKGMTVGLQNLGNADFYNLKSLFPLLPEQHAIVSYLDDKCGKIDEWVAQKRKELELLGEMKQRVTASAVTRGLNPNVTMKQTNIPWLPEVPEHWDCVKLKMFCQDNKEKNKGNVESCVLSLSYGNVIVKKNINFGLVPENYESYQIVNPGYIILRLTDLQNDHKSLRTGLVKNRGIITSAYVGLVVKNMNSEYTQLLLHSYDVMKVFYDMGGGLRQSMSYNDISNIYIPVPPLSEQRAIVSHITERTAKIDKMVENVNKEIEGIKEYKQRLISDVVTGQIKVC